MSPVILTSATSWQNKHETYTQPIRGLYLVQNDPGNPGDALPRYNSTTRLLQTIIADARRDNVRLRAFGGGWSFSGAPSTEGRLLDTSALNLWFRLSDHSVATTYTGDREGLVFLQCGNSIAGLNRNLRLKQRSLRTTGASNGQSIVGAMSTGTHGAALKIGAIQDYVVGIHLIPSPDRHLWIERDSYPVVTNEFAGRLGAEIVRNDEVFNAVLVSFGAFGLIHGVLIETDPIFLFEMHRNRMPLDNRLKTTIATLAFGGLGLPEGAEQPHHFDVMVNPHDMGGGAFITRMYRRPFRTDYAPPVPGDIAPGDDALAFIGLLTDLVPGSIPVAVNKVIAGKYKTLTAPILGTTNEMFPTTTTRGKAAGTGIGVPADRAIEVVERIVRINAEHGPFPCIVALRFVKQTQALLGFTRFQPTCVIDVDGPLSNRTRGFYSRIWQDLASSGIPYTMHWGKILGLGAAEVRRLYGGSLDRWLAVRHDLLDGQLRGLFSNRFLEELGLDQ